jgi:hypothetical protein
MDQNNIHIDTIQVQDTSSHENSNLEEEFDEDYSDNDLESYQDNTATYMYKTENEVYNTFVLLQKHVDIGISDLLQYMTLNDVYKLIHPRYDPPF